MKTGHVYIRWSVNWVLITLSATRSVCFAAEKFASWLFVMTHNAINLLYLSNLIGATTCQYARMITPQFL